MKPHIGVCVASVLGTTALSGCATDSAGPPATIPLSAAPVLGWRLPKTVLDTTVTYVPVACTVESGEPQLKLDVKVDIVARGVPDEHLGPDFPDGLVEVRQGDLNSFWIDSNLTYKLYAGRGGLLQSLSSHSTGEAGTIIGNVLTGIGKIAAVVTGGAAPGPGGSNPPNVCGSVTTTLKDIQALQQRIPIEEGKKAQDDALRIQNLKDAITVKVKRTFDPGLDAVTNGLLPVIKPPSADIVKAGWYGPDAPAVQSIHNDQHVYIALDFSRAALLAPCPQAAPECGPQPAPKGTLFRQAAYIPVHAMKGEIVPAEGTRKETIRDPVGDPQTIAFGQYGAARTLPVKAGGFQDITWEVDFSELGEITQATYASKAKGVAISSLFATAAGTASAYKSPASAPPGVVLDSDTLTLQAENAALQAQVDNKTLKAQLEALQDGAPPPN